MPVPEDLLNLAATLVRPAAAQMAPEEAGLFDVLCARYRQALEQGSAGAAPDTAREETVLLAFDLPGLAALADFLTPVLLSAVSMLLVQLLREVRQGSGRFWKSPPPGATLDPQAVEAYLAEQMLKNPNFGGRQREARARRLAHLLLEQLQAQNGQVEQWAQAEGKAAHPTGADFLLVFNGERGHYTVEAYGPRAISVPPQAVAWPFPASLQAEVERLHRGEAPARQRVQDLGSALYRAAFPPPVALAYTHATAQLAEGACLGLHLLLRPPELNALPWELLYDEEREDFLSLRRTHSLVRFIESNLPAPALPSQTAWRVLYLPSAPHDLPPLDLAAGERALRRALGEEAALSVVRPATLAALRQKLEEPFDVLHYDGHAAYDPGTQSASLYLQDEQGQARALGGELLAAFVAGTGIRLAVLAACETGQDGIRRRSSGLAHRLMVSSNLAAVAAMQFQVGDAAMPAFVGGFYAALGGGQPLERALLDGRRAIVEAQGGDPFAGPDWAAPVLFLRAGGVPAKAGGEG